MFWNKNGKKTFLIINSYFIGDILLVSPLIQNIKRLYPDSEVIMVTSEGLQDIAKYQQGVDRVVVWDRKNKDKGILGMLRFINRLHSKIYAAIPIYGMDRPLVLSAMTGAKSVFAPKRNNIISFLLRKLKYPVEINNTSVQELNMSLLSGITKEELINVPMVYNLPEIESRFDIPEPYIVLNPTSTRVTKAIPIDVTKELIAKLEYKVVLIGKSNFVTEYSEILSKENYPNLIDLSNKTTLLEATQIIKNAKGMISSDSGFMHMACALKTPVVVPFYETNTAPFKPDEKIYRAKVLSENQTADNMVSAIKSLID